MARGRCDSIIPFANTVDVENRKNKINYDWKDEARFWIFTFLCPIIGFVYFLCSVSNKTGLEFWVPISFGFFTPWLISILWKRYQPDNESKFADWGPSKWKCTALIRGIFHIISLPFIILEWDMLQIKRECAAAKSDADDTQFVTLFDRLVSKSRQHTFLENIGNTFGLGPQLFFSLYLICQVIHSGMNPLSNGGWKDVGEVLFISIPACTWIVICNRNRLNLANDKEKKMSTWHTVLLFIGHYLIIFGLFIPRAMLSAYSTSKFWIFFGIHVAIVCVGSLLYYGIVKSARQNMTKNVLGPAIVVASSFFSFADYRTDQLDFHDGIYYAIPFLENLVVLIALGLRSVSTYYEILFFSCLAIHLVGLIILGKCSTLFQLDVTDVVASGSTLSSSNTIWTGLAHRAASFRKFSVRFYSLVSQTSSTLLSWTIELRKRAFRRRRDNELAEVVVFTAYDRIEDELDEQPTAASIRRENDSSHAAGDHVKTHETVLTQRRRPQPKDINELRSDGDLGADEKNAILRKDLNWICWNMRRKKNLFQVLTLVLAENGSDVNARDEDGMTPALFLCLFYNQEDLAQILELLINKGADVKAVNQFGMTMLHSVCHEYSQYRNQKDIIDLLIKKGVPVDAKDAGGNTALHLIAEYYKHDNMKDIVELFIKAGVPVNAKNDSGRTVLHQLVENYKHDNLEDIIELFMKFGATVDAQDKDGRTVLHCLAENYRHNNKKSIFDLFIKARVPVDAIDATGRTVLHYLAKKYMPKNKSIFDLLIKAGVPVEAKDKWGDTALHDLALFHQHDDLEEIVRFLIDKGARLDVQNNLGCTPLMELCGNENNLKHVRVFSLLTPDASKDPLLSDTQSVIRLIDEFDKKKIGAKDLKDGLKQIRSDVRIKYLRQK